MTVSFTATDSIDPNVPSLTDLLAPQLRSRHGSPDPRSIALRCLTRGTAAGYSATAVRRWLIARADEDTVALASSFDAWRPLVQEAKRHLLLVSDSAGAPALRRQVARRWLARLASERPADVKISPRMFAQCKIALSIIAIQQMTLMGTGPGWDRIMVTEDWLATEMNLRPNAARAIRKRLEELGWIRRVSSRGRALLFRLTRLESPALRASAWEYADTIDAFAEWKLDDDELAAALSTVSSPAWAYDPTLGLRAWLRLVMSWIGDGKARTCGFSPDTSRKLMRVLVTELPTGLDGSEPLAAVLEERGEISFAVYLKAERKIELAAIAAENRKRLDAVRGAKAARWETLTSARGLIKAAYVQVGLPPVGREVGEAEQWVSAAAQYFNAGGGVALDPSMRELVAGELRARLLGREWGEALVEKAVGFIVREPVAEDVAA